jgi:hypothetical protein
MCDLEYRTGANDAESEGISHGESALVSILSKR